MRIGVIKTSLKENERRVAIWPRHFYRISASLRSQITIEENYGGDYGLEDNYFERLGITIADRDSILTTSDLVIFPKPVPQDLYKMKKGKVLFGWVHCVQQYEMTQAAIDRQLTLIAWEAMHHWSEKGEKLLHVFYRNNEIAGYAAVLHCLQLIGIDGRYGSRRRVVILGYGSVSRGAIYALQALGFKDINVFTRRPNHLVANQNPDVNYGQYDFRENGVLVVKMPDGNARPLIEELCEADIICNGILQNTNNPIIFVNVEQLPKLRSGTVIIDISCDEGMGFSFARPTSFTNPVFRIGNNVVYYSVDHTPTYLWNAASEEISNALLPYLDVVARGEEAWKSCKTIEKAIEIRNGVIQNPNILKFQRRKSQYPHEIEIQ